MCTVKDNSHEKKNNRHTVQKNNSREISNTLLKIIIHVKIIDALLKIIIHMKIIDALLHRTSITDVYTGTNIEIEIFCCYTISLPPTKYFKK